MPRKRSSQLMVEPSTEKRTSFPQKKVAMLARVEELSKKYDTIILSKLHKVRAGQLMLLRKNFRGQLEMFVSKNKIAELGLKQTNSDFVQNLTGQNALIFTNLSPFKLFLSMEKSKVNFAARAGDVATDEIVVPAGNTGIAPGPVLSEFKEAGVQTRIEAGSIYVSKDSIVAHPGDIISPKLAGLLSRLNIKPIKAGLSIFAALSEGLILLQKDISIDLNQYRADFARASIEALGVAIDASYATRETIPLLISRAFRQAREVAIESAYITPENAGLVIARATSQANALLNSAKQKGFSD